LDDEVMMLKKISAVSLSETNTKATFCTRTVYARKKNLQASCIGGVRAASVRETY
jgi:hypothetical protein